MSPKTQLPFDSLLLVAFGGPTSGDQGYAFVKGIVGDRPGAEARIREVASHYEKLGGSPFNELTFEQAGALGAELEKRGVKIPIYCGMRHWDPHVKDVMKKMADAGHKRTLAIIMAPHQCWISWDWYQNTVTAGNEPLGDRRLEVTYTEPWWTHPKFIESNADRIHQALAGGGEEARLVFTAHSIPINTCPDCKAGKRKCPYAEQFEESAKLIAAAVGKEETYVTSYQSQATTSPAWTKPDINDRIKELAGQGTREVVLDPIGFLCDHVEVLYDLDVEARKTCEDAGVTYRRAPTVGSHPMFIELLADRVMEACR